jgi:hypothetical protein
MKSTGLTSDWHYGLENNKFFLELSPALQKNLSFKEACLLRAKNIYESTNNPVLGISGGLDSQLVLHCFYSQGLTLDCVFRYFPGYNDNELANLKILEKKYGFKSFIVTIDPMKIKDEILKESNELHIPPNQLIYKKFVSSLPDDLDIIQGLEGPDVIKSSGKIYYIESYNSLEFSRRQAIDSLQRKGKFISFEKNSDILLSIFNDDGYETFINAYDYFNDQEHLKLSNKKLVFFWDLHVKTYLYHKHWKEELIYFPKFQGVENVDYIMNGPVHNYRKNLILLDYEKFKSFLNSSSELTNRFYQRPDPN